MALYIEKPGTPVEASPYAAGMEAGFDTFSSTTVTSNPVPTALQRVALLYVVKTGDEWTCSVPYLVVDGSHDPIFPDDYIITNPDTTKSRMAKAEFEAEYEIYSAP